MASQARADARSEALWAAIRRHVCGVCLDRADDGSCGLRGRTCAIERHLPILVEVLSRVQSPRMDEYVDAVEREICGTCPEQDRVGRCRTRDHVECALYAYLPKVLDAVEDVNGEPA
jgi:hypothetical protein